MLFQTHNSLIQITKISLFYILEHYIDDSLVFSEYHYNEQECILSFYKYCTKYCFSVIMESEELLNDYSID